MKSAYEKLIDLGWELLEADKERKSYLYRKCIKEENLTKYIEIDGDRRFFLFYHYQKPMFITSTFIEFELAKILVQYLEELTIQNDLKEGLGKKIRL